jgi:hypothetical protein
MSFKHTRRFPAQFAVFLLLLSSVRIWGSFVGHDCVGGAGEDFESSGSGEEAWDWWDNITNGTELCRGVIDKNNTNSSFPQPPNTNGSTGYGEIMLGSSLLAHVGLGHCTNLRNAHG